MEEEEIGTKEMFKMARFWVYTFGALAVGGGTGTFATASIKESEVARIIATNDSAQDSIVQIVERAPTMLKLRGIDVAQAKVDGEVAVIREQVKEARKSAEDAAAQAKKNGDDIRGLERAVSAQTEILKRVERELDRDDR